MIQPVSAFSPQAGFRGSTGAYLKQTKGLSSNSKIALLNAGGVSAAVGGLTMAVSRAHTTNWAHALVLGVFGAFLSMFFMTPQIIEKASLTNTLKEDAGALVKEDATKLSTAIKEYLRPVKKSVHFRQQA
jgi:mannitol-specific phosphotransferase system IIBC component